MNMDMVGDACTGDAAHVNADVKTVGLEGSLKQIDTPTGKSHEIQHLLIAEIVQNSGVFIWRDHEMAITIWECVHHDERIFAAEDDQVLSVLVFRRLRTEYAAVAVIRVLDISHAPRRPKSFHTM